MLWCQRLVAFRALFLHIMCLIVSLVNFVLHESRHLTERWCIEPMAANTGGMVSDRLCLLNYNTYDSGWTYLRSHRSSATRASSLLSGVWSLFDVIDYRCLNKWPIGSKLSNEISTAHPNNLFNNPQPHPRLLQKRIQQLGLCRRTSLYSQQP